MNMNKILAAGLIAAVATVAQAETQCGNGGFYMGATLGASFNKVTAKFDKASLTAKLEAQAKALAEKLKAAQTAAETAYAEVDATALKAAFDVVLTNLKNTASGANTAITALMAPEVAGKAAAQSLAAFHANSNNKDTVLFKILEWLNKYDSTALASDEFTKKIENTTDLSKTFDKAIDAAIEAGAIQELLEACGTVAANNNIVIYPGTNLLAAVNIARFAAADKKTGEYYKFTAKDSKYTVYNTALTNVTETVKALKKAAKADDASAASDVVSLFYSDVKTKTAETALGANEIADQLVKYPAGKVEKEMTELKANASGVASKKATGFLFGANFGFDHRINDIMLGIELEAGMEAGGKAKFRDDSKTNGLTARRQFYVSLMPRIGYLFAPQFEGFLTFGGSLGKYKVDTSLWNTVFDKTSAEFTSMVNSYNENHSDKIDATVNGTDAAKVYKSHSKTKFVPVIGAGIRYEITPEIFATLAYNFTFKTTIADTKTAGSQFKFQSHILKAGVGFRF